MYCAFILNNWETPAGEVSCTPLELIGALFVCANTNYLTRHFLGSPKTKAIADSGTIKLQEKGRGADNRMIPLKRS